MASEPETRVAGPEGPASAPSAARNRRLWLVCNSASGSNDEESQRAVKAALERAGYTLARTLHFPDDAAPKPADLDADGAGLVAVFGGDGTVHAVVTGLFGWRGAVLVLPGGTMNMLSKKLHGDVALEIIADRLRTTGGQRVRTPTISSRHAMGLTGVLAGPGTVWNEVREAMRAVDIVEFLSTTRQAISYSANGPKVTCAEVDCGREDGYAAITLVPQEGGLEAKGYYAESLADFAGQGIALLNRNFRDGPHDDLGRHGTVRLVCPAGEPMGLLIDGEPFDGAAEETFDLGICGVDLIATHAIGETGGEIGGGTGGGIGG
ncbi:diacylglycerol kinase [Novosphingobium sp. 1949]|uniref:Diacylglycerol kinase n=1 Tax=Novosphingobium organovorum TaxID=2930092 RepID=A0ABT0BB27_9SPHN|nr:diacylglycerol kinase family protein [Novosphingobium organovorum]MCJ2182233.1 diacylglycerol kinase [Novosphingobium organovorum]